MAACSEMASKTDALVGSSGQACLSAAFWSFEGTAPVRSLGEIIIGKTDCNNRDLLCKYMRSLLRAMLNKHGQTTDRQ